MKQDQIISIAARMKPVVTEKALQSSDEKNNKVVFEAPVTVTKYQAKRAIESLYKGVKVLAVNSVVSKGKVKRFKGVIGKRPDVKKLILKLSKPIDISSEVSK